MWKLVAFIVSSLLLMSVAFPLEPEAAAFDTKPIILEAIDIPPPNAAAKPSEEAKPLEAAAPIAEPSTQSAEGDIPVEAQPIAEEKPSELKPSEPSSSSTVLPTVTTFVEAVPINLSPEVSPLRRQVHYDQRQDGKFNIRADLDNFVILVVPSTGASLLDLLKRSNQKPQHHKRNHNKSHKKYYSKTTSVKTTVDKNNNKESNRLDYLRPDSAELAARPIGGEFIEGRTPYHVDISSSEISQSAPTSIADLPLSNNPSVVDATVFLPAQLKGNKYARNLQSISTLALYPRHRKSLTNDDQTINTNSVSLTPVPNDNNNYQHDNGNGNGNDDIDKTEPTEILTGPEFFSLNVASIEPLAIAHDTKTTTKDSQLELTLLGAQEQCGPDRRRDSYGICQFVPQDYATK